MVVQERLNADKGIIERRTGGRIRIHEQLRDGKVDSRNVPATGGREARRLVYVARLLDDGGEYGHGLGHAFLGAGPRGHSAVEVVVTQDPQPAACVGRWGRRLSLHLGSTRVGARGGGGCKREAVLLLASR